MCLLRISQVGNSQDLRFSRISINNGLSQANVTSICQDSIGFLWIGTMDGLNRYDGHTIKIYNFIPDDTTSLSNPAVRCLFVDHTGVLWVGTEDGLNRYDSENDMFYQFRHVENDSISLSNNNISAICEDEDGELWIATKGGGINQLDRKTGEFRKFYVSSIPGNISNSNFVNALLPIPDFGKHELVLATDNGLFTFSTQSYTFHQEKELNDSLHRTITTLLPVGNDMFWIGTWGRGLISWNRKTGKIKSFNQKQTNSTNLPDNIILSLTADRMGNIWAGTRGGGLAIYSQTTNSFTISVNQVDNPSSISDNTIPCGFLSKDGQLWFGSQYGGLNKYNPAQKNFHNTYFFPGSISGLSNNLVTSFYLDKQGILWVGTRGGGLNRIDRKNKKIEYFQASDAKQNGLSNNLITSISIDNQRKYLWIGTDGGGLNRFDPINRLWKIYSFNSRLKGKLSNAYIYSLSQDTNGKLWIGTWGTNNSGGLDLFDPKTEEFTNFHHIVNDSNTIGVNIVLKTFVDSKGNVWIGTKGDGLYFFIPDETMQAEGHVGYMRHFAHIDDNPQSLSNNDVYAINEDAYGNIWVGTFSGLNRFEPDIGGFSHFTKNNGLPSNTINGILDDQKGNLWISTSLGLACINASGDVSVFHKEDGLQDDVFLPGSYYKSSAGELFFGGINGFTSFFPDSIRVTDNTSPVAITDIKIYDNHLKEQKRKLFYYQGHWNSNGGVIRLTPRDFMISIEFSSIEFYGAEEKKYQYKLEGFSDDWIQTQGNEQRAVFTNLNPGTYIFRASVTGTFSATKDETFITIIVQPPFYRTLLFKIAVALLLAFILTWIFVRRLERLRKEKLLIEKQARESLFEERNQLRTLIDHIPDIIYIKDRNSRFIVANRELARMMGNRKPEELVGETDHLYYSPEVANAYFNEEQELMRNGVPQINHIVPRFDRQGKKGFISLTRVPLRNSAGEVVGIVGISRDVSQLKKTEEKLIEQTSQLQDMNTILVERQEEIRQQAERLQTQSDSLLISNDELERLNATKDKLFSIIAHDLKNPFHAIIGFTNLLSLNYDSLPDQEKHELIELINTSAENAFTLLENLLNWARTQTDTIKFNPGPLNIKEVIEENLRFINSSAHKKQIKVQSHLMLNVVVYADKNMLDTILRNLLNNAVKFTAEAGEINVFCEIIKGYAEIRISDTGVGMSPETQAAVFRLETYYSSQGTSGEAGTGLGLIISREFIEKHGGSLKIESQVGKGSTFIFTLPLEVDG